MKIYSDRDKQENSIELLLNHNELKKLINGLWEFERNIEKYKADNKGKSDLGFTHMHYKDIDRVGEKDEPDIVFYVDLDA